MSIILKALRKAEGRKPPQGQGVFISRPRRPAWGLLAALVATLVLVVALLFYLLGPQAKRQEAPPPQEATPVAPKQGLSVDTGGIEALLRAGQYSQAEALARKALQRTPGAELYNLLGLALKGQGRLKEATEAYQRALALDASFPEAANNLAVALEAQGRRKEAEEFYQEALRLNPSYPEAHLNYALLLEATGRTAQAMEHYRTFLSLSDDEELKALVRARLRYLR